MGHPNSWPLPIFPDRRYHSYLSLRGHWQNFFDWLKYRQLRRLVRQAIGKIEKNSTEALKVLGFYAAASPLDFTKDAIDLSHYHGPFIIKDQIQERAPDILLAFIDAKNLEKFPPLALAIAESMASIKLAIVIVELKAKEHYWVRDSLLALVKFLACEPEIVNLRKFALGLLYQKTEAASDAFA